MKKIISIFLSLVIALSSFSGITAFAQEDVILTLDEPVYFEGENTVMHFECDEDEYYSINGLFLNKSAISFSLRIYDESGKLIINSEIYNTNLISSEDYIVIELKAGNRYKLEVSMTKVDSNEVGLSISKHTHTLEEVRLEPTCIRTGYIYYDCTDKQCSYASDKTIIPISDEHRYIYGTCDLCCKKDENYTDFKTKTLSLNETKTISVEQNEYCYFIFTPEDEGYYNISTSSYSGRSLSLFCFIDGDKQSYSNKNVMNFKAGVTYELGVKNSYCSDKVSLQINKHTHNFVKKTYREANCLQSGYAYFKCDSCDYEYYEEYPQTPNEHKYVNGSCKVCNKADESYIKVVTPIEEHNKYLYQAVYGGEKYYFTYTVPETALYDFVFNSNTLIPKIEVYVNGNKTISRSGVKEFSEIYNKGDKLEITITLNEGSVGNFDFGKHIHTYKTEIVAASCNSIGYTEYTCTNSICGYSYKSNKKEPTGNHNFTTEVIKPTCVDYGVTMYYCTKCGIGYACDYVAPDPTKHHFYYGVCEYCNSYNASTTNTALILEDTVNITVSTKGVFVNYSPSETGWYVIKSNCTGYTDLYAELYDEYDNLIADNDDISSSNYNFKITVKLEKNKKYRLYIGSYETNSVSAPVSLSTHNHKFSKTQINATCGKKGCIKYFCSCGQYYYDSITPATGKHSYKTAETYQPNCTFEGYTLQQCSNCKQERNINVVKPNGVHSYVDGICIYCETIEPKASEYSSTANLGNNNISIKEKNQIANLKFSPNKDGYYIINTNGYYDTYGVLLDKFGYELVSDNDSGLGNNFSICFYLVAGEKYTIQLRVLDEAKADLTLSISMHTHSFAELTVPPSCGEQGSTLYTCKTCYYSYESSFVPATNEHNYSNGICKECNELDPDLKSVPLIVDKSVKASGETIFSFVAQYSCLYTIKSSSKYDMSGILFDEFFDNIQIEESNAEYSNDFIFNVKLNAGTKYYLVVTPSYEKEYSVSLSVNHTTATRTVKATTSSNGKSETYCKTCSSVLSTKTVYYPKKITLSSTKYTYDGNYKKPTVTVTDSKGNKFSAANYSVAYSNNKYVGKGSVKITFKGNYSGSKTMYFTINPKGTSISKLTAASKGFKVSWKKQASETTGYQIQYSANSKFSNPVTVTVTKNSTTSKSISKLKAKKKYYVRVRTYKTVNGAKYYSSWSGYKYITTKS